MTSIIAAISSSAVALSTTLRRLGAQAWESHLQYCELLVEAQRRY
jgi:hypothetical protein